MRVLHVLIGLPSGGLEQLALQLIRHAPPPVEVELLNAAAESQALAPAVEALRQEGRLQAHHQWPRCDGPRLAWRSFRLCRRRLPDALLIYPCNRPMLWLALGARLAGVRRLAVAVQNTAPRDLRERRTWHRLLRWFQRLGVLAVPCTQAVVASLAPLPPDLRLEPVILNGCDTTAIASRAAAARRLRPADDPRRVLMVARLDPIKDQATLLRAFAAAAMPGWQLWLAGDGPARAELEQLARDLGLDPAAVFLGVRADIPELLGQADLFAFSTTEAEGFGIAVIEALAAGLPVLASDVAACREVLGAGAAGELLSPGSVTTWRDQLAALMPSESCRDALARRALAAAPHHDIRRCSADWYSLLER